MSNELNGKTAADAVLIEFPENILEMVKVSDINTAMTPKQLVDSAVKDNEQSLEMFIKSGLKFVLAKKQAQHGDFQNMVKDSGLAIERAREAMAFVKKIAGAPPVLQEFIKSKSKTQAIALSRVSLETIYFVHNNPDIFDGKTEKESARLIRVIENNDSVLEEKDHALKELKLKYETAIDKLKHKSPNVDSDGGAYPRHVDEARFFSQQYYKQCELALGQLDLLRQQHNDRPYDNPNESKIVARALYHGVAPIAKMALDLIKNLEAENIAEIADDFTTNDYLNEDELVRFLARAKFLVDQQETINSKINYQIDAARPKGKGRPKQY